MSVKSDDVITLMGDVIPAFPYRFKDVMPEVVKNGLEFYVCLVFCVIAYC